jgi:glycosyltransferase involved in cell wall biosynthesis
LAQSSSEDGINRVTTGTYVLIAIPVLLVGGTEIQTLNLVNVLVSAGYRVLICCYYEYDQDMVKRFETAGATVTLLKYERAKGLWHLAKGLMKLFREKKPDIVHVQYIAPGLVPIVAAKIAGVKTIFATVHQPGSAYGWKAKMLLRTAARFCTAFFCVSRSVEETWFGDSEVFDPDNITAGRRHFTVYNAVDADRIESIVKATNREELRKSLGVNGKKIVGVVGRLREEKGQIVLLDAMVEVIKTIPDAMLLVVGDGPDRVSLELRAKSLGLASNILWLGQKNPEEVYQLYSIMDVLAVPSLFEGFGFAAAEAMAAGIPVVGTRIDGLTEVVDDGVTGILVPPNDSPALAHAILEFVGDTTRAESAGVRGKERAVSLFSVERFRTSMLASYKQFVF